MSPPEGEPPILARVRSVSLLGDALGDRRSDSRKTNTPIANNNASSAPWMIRRRKFRESLILFLPFQTNCQNILLRNRAAKVNLKFGRMETPGSVGQLSVDERCQLGCSGSLPQLRRGYRKHFRRGGVPATVKDPPATKPRLE